MQHSLYTEQGRSVAIKPRNLPVKDYIKSHNPAALALAATMDLGDSDLVEIKIGILRSLAHSVKNSAELMKSMMFVDQYLWEDDHALRIELDKIYDNENSDMEDSKMGRLMEAIEARGISLGEAKRAELLQSSVCTLHELGIDSATIAQKLKVSIDEVLAVLTK